MEIVSGRTGSPHVTSTQFRQMLEGSIGQGSYILSSGNNIESELVSNNQLKIKSGMICHHGCISAVQLGTYDTVTLDNGSQGKKRIDLVVNRYTKNSNTGIEACNWVVIKGAESSTTAVAPSATVGNLQDGDLIDDCPVFELHYDGINVTEVKKLLSVASNLAELNSNIYPVGSIYMTTVPDNPKKYFGGTWVLWGSGRVPVCVNPNDDNFATPEKTGGESKHKLTSTEMPPHTHSYYSPIVQQVQAAKSGEAYGNYGKQYKIETSSAGSGNAHNNLQPYITCYMWKRTA